MQAGANPALAGRYDVNDLLSGIGTAQYAAILAFSVVTGGLLWFGVWLYGRHQDWRQQQKVLANAAARAQEQLNLLHEAARGVIGPQSRTLLQRLDHNLSRLGELDRGEVAIPPELHALVEANRNYYDLMADRCVVDNAISLVGDDTPEDGHTVESYDNLAERAAQLVPQVWSVGTANTVITELCETIEKAVGNATQRHEKLTQRHVLLAEKIEELKSRGIVDASLRRRVGSVSFQLTQASTATTDRNFMTAKRHLDAAQRLINELTAHCKELQARPDRITAQIAAFDEARLTAMDNMTAVQNQLSALAANYSPAALRELSDGFTKNRQAMERARTRLVDLRRHMAKGELEAAETLAATIESAFTAVQELAAQAEALPGRLAEAAATYRQREADVIAEINGLLRRIGVRSGKQRLSARRATDLLPRVKATAGRVRRNPIGALNELEEIRKEVSTIEKLSQAATKQRT